MLVLAIDCALDACSTAVLDSNAGAIVASQSRIMARGHAEALMPLIARVMDEAAIEFTALDRIAVTVGPGSFTGLRVGIAAVWLTEGIFPKILFQQAVELNRKKRGEILDKMQQLVHEKAPANSTGELVSIATETDRTLYFDFLPLDLGTVAGNDAFQFVAFDPNKPLEAGQVTSHFDAASGHTIVEAFNGAETLHTELNGNVPIDQNDFHL